MLSLKVSGMTCGGCINAVTRAVQTQDPQAKVQADLASQTVTLETTLSVAQASQLITDAGFPVVQQQLFRMSANITKPVVFVPKGS